MIENWIWASWAEVGMVLLSFVGVYLGIIGFTRVAGLRSFSKMSASDFAMTVAVGSLFASTISSPSPTLIIGLVALAALFAGQSLIAIARAKLPGAANLVDNRPLLIMARGKILKENLRDANMTRADLFAKLREANAMTYQEVHAVVFEATGDISVLHGSEHSKLEPDFFEDVRGCEALFG